MIKAGDLNHKITFQIKPVSKTENGYDVGAWIDHSTRWAQKITTGGREFYAAKKVNEETTAVFRLRYTQAITTSMRIRDGNSYFEILPPLNNVDSRHEELLISAKEVR